MSAVDKAIERVVDCGIRVGVDYAKGVDSTRDEGYLVHAKAALQALLKPTITPEDVEAAALSLAGRSSWSGLSTYIKNIIMDDARACLEAVAVARQRAGEGDPS